MLLQKVTGIDKSIGFFELIIFADLWSQKGDEKMFR